MQTTTTTYRCPHCNRAAEFDHISDGEVVTCPSPDCGKEFRAKLPEATPEPALIIPGGDENAPQAVPVQNGPANGEKPSEEEAKVFSHESEENPVLAVYSVPMLTRHPFRFLGYVLVCLAGFAGLITGIVNYSTPFIILSGLVLLVGVFLLGGWWMKTRRTTVTVTPKTLVISDGVFSERKVEVHHQNISSIDIYQSPTCRLLGTGARSIRCGAEEDQSVYLDSVSEPHALVQQIRDLGQK
jgi:hypothetical protein